MAGYQFTNNGADPMGLSKYKNNPLGVGLSPKSKALTNMQTTTPAYQQRTSISTPNIPGIPEAGSTTTTQKGAYQPQFSATPTTPVKKVNNADGSSVEYHAPTDNYDVKTGLLTSSGKSKGLPEVNAPKSAPLPAPIPTPIPALTPFQESYRGLINTGKTAQDISKEYGSKIADVGALGARAQAGQLTTGTSPVAEGTAAITAQTTAAQQAALAAGQEAALKGTGQNIEALGTAGGLTKPIGTVPNVIIDPTTGLPITGGGTQNAIIQGGNYQTIADFTQKYNAGKARISGADAIQNQIVNTLKANPSLNTTPISAFTNLKEFFSGQTSDPAQQLLSQQVNSYITQLGLDPASVVNIASQSKLTLGQLLDSLRETAVGLNEANNPANVNVGGATSKATGGTMFGSFFS